MQKISIVIPVWREVDIKLTEICVDSLRRNSKEEHEIIVVVNPGTDVSAYQHLRADKIIGIEEQGQCHANNRGIAESQHEWIMVVDNDNVFPPDWEKCLKFLKPNLVLTLNSFEPVTGIPGVIAHDYGTYENFDVASYEKDAVAQGKFIQGFFYPFIVEKKHFETVGGFDSEFDPLGSTCDTDLRYKFMLLGLDLQRYFGVLCYHFAQITSVKGGDEEEKGRLRDKNRYYFERKWSLAQAPSPQIWTSEFKLDKDKLRFKPDWMNQVSDKWMGTADDNQYWQCGNCRQMNFNFRNKCFSCGYEKR